MDGGSGAVGARRRHPLRAGVREQGRRDGLQQSPSTLPGLGLGHRAPRLQRVDEDPFAGGDGLDAYRALAPQLPRLLGPGGLAAVEIGFDQGDVVKAGMEEDVESEKAGDAAPVSSPDAGSPAIGAQKEMA